MRFLRYGVIALLLLAATIFTLAAAPQEGAQAQPSEAPYPAQELLASAGWLQEQLEAEKPGLVVVDVRTDEHFDGQCIPGAIRLPWRELRTVNKARQLPGIFVGVDAAQTILGEHGIARSDEVVLYDDVERDGGATASYVFWVLDVLGHEKKRVLEGGLEAWQRQGLSLTDSPATREATRYQAPAEEIRLRREVDGDFIQKRLGDPYYQILDARSSGEYLGRKLNKGMDGRPLKKGHVPTAFNRPYSENWKDAETKLLKPYAELQQLYRGLDPDHAVVTYCHSARRGSYAYFVLRLMGFRDVILYDNSWFEWGNPDLFYPTERDANPMQGALPGTGETAKEAEAGTTAPDGSGGPDGGEEQSGSTSPGGSGSQMDGGYVSCGG